MSFGKALQIVLLQSLPGNGRPLHRNASACQQLVFRYIGGDMKVVPITQENAHIFEVFEQDYESEFSAITKKEPNAEGRFAIEADWGAPNKGFYLFIEDISNGIQKSASGNPVGYKPAGFAVRGEIDGRSDIAEFYILPCYRKKGLGKLFAFADFDRFHGPWQVRQISTAVEATSFWRTVIHEYTHGNYAEDQINDPHWGVVIRQRFTSKP